MPSSPWYTSVTRNRPDATGEPCAGIFGGRGRDGIAAIGGRDEVYGGRGSDLCLLTEDGRRGDLLRGGPGVDKWYADRADDVLAERQGDYPGGCQLLD